MTAPSSSARPAAPADFAPAPPLSSRTAALFVVIAGAAFSFAGPLARWARPAHPLVIAFGRVALAALLLTALGPRVVGRSFAALSPRQRAGVLGAGVLLAVHFALFLWGLDRTSLPAALSLIALEPLSVVLCSWAFFRIRPSRPEQIGVLLATAGAALIARGSGSGEHHVAGDLMVLGAVALYGLYVAAARGLKDALPAQAYSAIVYAAAALSLGLALPLAPGVLASAWPLPGHAALAIVLIALFPTVLGHTSVQWAARKMPPAVVALVSPGEALGGIAIGAAWLGAVPTPTEIAGALIILTGTTIAIFGHKR